MKIAWFTPFEKKSAIGKYSKYAVEALSKFIEVDLFIYCAEQVRDKDVIMQDSFVNCIYYSSTDVIYRLLDYDLCVYNMGDNVNYHGMIYDVLKKYPGVVIAHDICMHNFMRGYYLDYKHELSTYIDLLQKKYGQEEAQQILSAANSVQEWQKMDLLKYNMLDEILSNARGVIVHSQYHKYYVELSFGGPILVTPLLYPNELAMESIDKTMKDCASDKISILTVGVVNPNKHVDSIIQAIGESTILKNRINYTVIGSLDNEGYVNQLKDLIQQYELCDTVQLLDYVEEQELQCYYQQTDLITNLRYPALEGGSASLVEQMQWGKAIIAVDTGVYAEIPNDCIYKINAKRMINEVRTLFENLVNGNSNYEQCARNALEYAKKHFCTDKYVSNLQGFLEEVEFSLPLHEVLVECNKFTSCMKDTVIYSMIAKELEDLYAVKREDIG